MRSVLRWLTVAGTAGVLLLLFSARTGNDVVAAQENKPVVIYRFYEGRDGLSHVEKIPVTDFNDRGIAPLLMTAPGAELHRTKPTPPDKGFSPFHPGPKRQYIVNLQGHEEIEFSGGEKITLGPGDIELIEDLAPAKGHRNRTPGPDDRLALWITIADQNVVRDSILK